MTTTTTIEDKYKRVTQIEHVLLRPQIYIRSVEQETESRWVYDSAQRKMVHKPQCTIIPGLVHLFEEILTNAADNFTRSTNPKMTYIQVVIDAASGTISVTNDGECIPIVIHKVHNIYVGELIFGSLLTSSNYTNNRGVGAGLNGYGAKLANIFSTEFSVVSHDAVRGSTYRQRWSNNMRDVNAPSITPDYALQNYTTITFHPDYAQFNVAGLTQDHIDHMVRRVWDISGLTSGTLKVFLNGVQCVCPSFKQYVEMYSEGRPVVCDKVNPCWTIAVCAAPDNGNSWVNCVCTSRGGTHVTYIFEQIVAKLTAHITKKHKVAVKPADIKAQMSLYINCQIENPDFDTQTKEKLTTKPSAYGSVCEINDDFIKHMISDTQIVQQIVNAASQKTSSQLKKTDGKRNRTVSGIDKLDDAEQAGGRHSGKCTLLLVEGDSAKALATAGLSVIGREYFGVFPLRGKLLNVREAKAKQILDNEELSSIKKILGLQQGVTYDSADSLRYGHVMIMTDSDPDGTHIRYLLLNIFSTFWPSLLRLPGFFLEFITPLVKVKLPKSLKTAGVVGAAEALTFYNSVEYEAWMKQADAKLLASATHKYYKGLGTSTAEEAKGYFANYDRHKVELVWTEEVDQRFEITFGAKHANKRKEWLSEAMDKSVFVDKSKGWVLMLDEMKTELNEFHRAANQRAIPCAIDGLKVAQRKILFSCFLKKLYVGTEIKVAQLAGYVAEKSAYHHGEEALCSTIIGMAQDFVNSNNINLLLPLGMLGTRLQNGKDAASSRYVFTTLSPITRRLFPQADDSASVIKYIVDDGQLVEPEWYLPIIPLVLVNGCRGIGVGYSTDIPMYNPRQIVEVIRKKLNDAPVDEISALVPWYKDFRGTITRKGLEFITSGVVTQSDPVTLNVTELPIGISFEAYRATLNTLVEADTIKKFTELHTDTRPHFVLKIASKAFVAEEWIKELQLTTTLRTSNMVLFDAQGKLRVYPTPESIVEEHMVHRLQGYNKRKLHLLAELRVKISTIQNKVRFVQMVVDRTLDLTRSSKKELTAKLVELEFQDDDGFDYLLGMSLYSVTPERVEQLQKQAAQLLGEEQLLHLQTPKDMWLSDLDDFIHSLDVDDEEKKQKEVDNHSNSNVKITKKRNRGLASPMTPAL